MTLDHSDRNGDPEAQERRLDSWKEFAAYLDRTVRTAQLWEKNEGLPIHRHQHDRQGTVFAYPGELDQWLAHRAEAPPAAKTAAPRVRFPVATLGVLGVVALVALAAVGWLALGTSGDAAGTRRLPFEERDWVIIAAFENRAGEEIFDGTAEAALASELANSSFVNVAPRPRIEDALRLMRKPLATRIEAAIGREVCLRDGEIQGALKVPHAPLREKRWPSNREVLRGKHAARGCLLGNLSSQKRPHPAETGACPPFGAIQTHSS